MTPDSRPFSGKMIYIKKKSTIGLHVYSAYLLLMTFWINFSSETCKLLP
jgi:hypothetical protein